MDKEILELKSENQMFFCQDDKMKIMMKENEKLKSENSLMNKEVVYADEKLRTIKDEISKSEAQNRLLHREKDVLEEKLSQLNLIRESSNERILE